MNIKKFKQQIKGVFKLPVKRYYLGKLTYGTPYFYPRSFHETIISVRKLKLKSEKDRNDYVEKRPHLKNDLNAKFFNIPMVRRCKDLIVKLFNNYYFIQYGWPISIKWVQLGWKWKYDTIRFEWPPSFQIYFFKWQFCIFWNAPDNNDDLYYEMALWYLRGANADIKEAEKTWGWTDYNTKESTWNKEYLI